VVLFFSAQNATILTCKTNVSIGVYSEGSRVTAPNNSEAGAFPPPKKSTGEFLEILKYYVSKLFKLLQKQEKRDKELKYYQKFIMKVEAEHCAQSNFHISYFVLELQ